eukprot:m.171989 g.171989  ORF g.171989 m.171989 type:complete len:283 (-) comp16509_c12_seq2:1516-2364(-)
MTENPSTTEQAVPQQVEADKPRYRLFYFDLRGRAEPIRLAFHLGGLKFDDVRIRPHQWCQLKPKCPYGQLPILEFDGNVLAQSNTILRFVGKKTGLYPSDDLEAAHVDEVLDLIEDINSRVISTIREKNMERKMAARRELATELLPKWLSKLNTKFEHGYVLGENESIADLSAFGLVQWLTMGVIDGLPVSLVEKQANLRRLQEQIRNHPKLQEYFQLHYNKEPSRHIRRFIDAMEKYRERCANGQDVPCEQKQGSRLSDLESDGESDIDENDAKRSKRLLI